MGRLEGVAIPHSQCELRLSRRPARLRLAVTVGALLWISWAFLGSHWQANTSHGAESMASSGENEGITDWDQIEPSEDLHWHPCFDEFLCARLTVPMDYNRPLNRSTPFARSHPKVHIALIMLPGKNRADPGAWSESPLLVNPGGPGGSGIALVMLAGRPLQTIAGADRDIIGFDPRGIGETTPRADCFSDMSIDPEDQSPYERRASNEGSLMNRILWRAENAVVGLPNTSSTATEQTVVRARGLTKLCNFYDDQDSILRFAGTPNVAQDMLSIVQAWDKWTSGLEKERLVTSLREQVREEVITEHGDTNLISPPPSTRGKLVYWGFSYGTILGATFATMFPDHVGRLVLDGVVNSDEWYFENTWKTAPQDMDKVIDRFLYYCHKAKESCELYRDGDKLEDLKARFQSILDSLADQTRVYAIKGSAPVYLTYSAVKSLLFAASYSPAIFPVIAFALDALHRGVDMSMLVQPIDWPLLCNAKARGMTFPDDGQIAVLCSDQSFRLNESRPALEAELQKMMEVSSFGDVSFTIAARCAGWDIDHVEPPSMDWDKFPLKDREPVNTSFPILFVSNTHDPITPIRSGLAQSRKFLNAGFIEQKGEGHCSLAMASFCTVRKIQAYFSKGIVPDKPRFDDSDDPEGSFSGNWTTCEVNQRPWDVPGADLRSKEEYTAEELELFTAALHLQKTFGNIAKFPSYPHGLERLLSMDEGEIKALLATATPRHV